MYYCTNTSGITFTVTSATALSVGQSIDIIRFGTGATAGTVTIAQGSGATLVGTPAYTLRAQYSAATIYCVAANSYVVIGDLG
jgi:hypothetical protein